MVERMKVVINSCWGGFGLSREALHWLREHKHAGAQAEIDIGEPWDPAKPAVVRASYLDSFLSEIDRADPLVIQCIKELGAKKARAPLAELRVVSIPDDVKYEINNYDGRESIHEKHRSWG